MILELARIEIDPDKAEDFERAVALAEPHFRSHGALSFALRRSIEYSGRYWLTVAWDSVEAHTVFFRASDGFAAWRELASPFFLSPPDVEHLRELPSPPE